MAPDDLKKQFAKMYVDEADSIYRFCLLRTSDKEVALDIMQESFLSFWEVVAAGRVEVHRGRAFLFTIARNRIIDWYRRKKAVSLDALAEAAETDIEVFMESEDGKAQIEMSHEARALLGKIRDLDATYQQAVYLRYVEDLRPKEIAQILGVTVNVVSVRLHRGLKQLRKVAGYDEAKHD